MEKVHFVLTLLFFLAITPAEGIHLVHHGTCTLSCYLLAITLCEMIKANVNLVKLNYR